MECKRPRCVSLSSLAVSLCVGIRLRGRIGSKERHHRMPTLFFFFEFFPYQTCCCLFSLAFFYYYPKIFWILISKNRKFQIHFLFFCVLFTWPTRKYDGITRSAPTSSQSLYKAYPRITKFQELWCEWMFFFLKMWRVNEFQRPKETKNSQRKGNKK